MCMLLSTLQLSNRGIHLTIQSRQALLHVSPPRRHLGISGDCCLLSPLPCTWSSVLVLCYLKERLPSLNHHFNFTVHSSLSPGPLPFSFQRSEPSCGTIHFHSIALSLLIKVSHHWVWQSCNTCPPLCNVILIRILS